jgi:hypothetical protein
MLDAVRATHGRQTTSLGADKGFDDGEFFRAVEAGEAQVGEGVRPA